MDLHDIGGRWRGHSLKHILFYREEYNFDINYRKGGIENLHLEFQMDKQYIDEKEMPFMRIDKVHIDFDHTKIEFNIDSGNILMKGVNLGIKIIKTAVLAIVKPIINNGPLFTQSGNAMLALILSESHGRIPMGPLQMMLMSLPQNDIKIPDDISLNYGVANGHQAWIGNDRINGFFDGKIEGTYGDDIHDGAFGEKGDLTLEDNGSPFQFEISNNMINNMFNIILGQNKINVDCTFDQFKQH